MTTDNRPDLAEAVALMRSGINPNNIHVHESTGAVVGVTVTRPPLAVRESYPDQWNETSLDVNTTADAGNLAGTVQFSIGGESSTLDRKHVARLCAQLSDWLAGSA